MQRGLDAAADAAGGYIPARIVKIVRAGINAALANPMPVEAGDEAAPDIVEKLSYELHCLDAGGRQYRVVEEALAEIIRHRALAKPATAVDAVRESEDDLCPFKLNEALVCIKPTNFHRVGEIVVIEGLDRRYASDRGPYWVRLIGKPGHYGWPSFRRASGLEIAAALSPTARAGRFQLGERVTKTKGSSWTGRVVGTYSTALTPEGYAVESEREPGSVQIYPAAALALAGTAQEGRE